MILIHKDASEDFTGLVDKVNSTDCLLLITGKLSEQQFFLLEKITRPWLISKSEPLIGVKFSNLDYE